MLSIAYVLCILLFTIAYCSHQCKILVTTDGLSSSHVMFHYRLAETLAKSGLDVTFYHAQTNSDVDIKNPNPLVKYWKYQAHHDLHAYDQFVEDESTKAFQQEKFDWNTVSRLRQMEVDACNFQLTNNKLMTDIRKANFDIVFGHPSDYCWLGLIHKLNVSSFVCMSEGLLWDMFGYYLRLPAPSSYVPQFMQSFTDEMFAKERALNALATAITRAVCYYIFAGMNNVFFKWFGPDFPSVGSLLPRSKLLVINSEELLDFSKPIFDKIVYVGGLAIVQPKPLSGKWKELLENKRYKGTILFSMGSLAKSSKIPLNIQIAFVATFKRFSDYQFIMKLDEQIQETANASNIYIAKWLPQVDLLDHPNLIAFITHGGWNSVLESARAGVPMIVIPLFSDQYGNMKRVDKRGLGFGLNKLNLTVQNIESALNKMLNNSTFRFNARKLSGMIKSKPIEPTELLVQWTNALCAIGGNFTALRPKAAELSFIQYYFVDLFVFACAIVFVTSYSTSY